MSDQNTAKPFHVDTSKFRSKQKTVSKTKEAEIDARSNAVGFPSREEHGRRGRKPSPRTGQIHAKVLPAYSETLADEARRKGVTQGVLLEEAWSLYCQKHSIELPD